MILNKELIDKLNEFEKVFSQPVPLMMIPPHISNEILIQIIDNCISRQENTLLQQLNIKQKENILY